MQMYRVSDSGDIKQVDVVRTSRYFVFLQKGQKEAIRSVSFQNWFNTLDEAIDFSTKVVDDRVAKAVRELNRARDKQKEVKDQYIKLINNLKYATNNNRSVQGGNDGVSSNMGKGRNKRNRSQ